MTFTESTCFAPASAAEQGQAVRKTSKSSEMQSLAVMVCLLLHVECIANIVLDLFKAERFSPAFEKISAPDYSLPPSSSRVRQTLSRAEKIC
jgi:hypothetical protein